MLMKIWIVSVCIVMIAAVSSCRSHKSTNSSSGNFSADNLVPKNASKNALRVIKEARAYTGTTYKLGGFDRRGIDCSGLVKKSFESIDLKLPRTSRDQSGTGKEVKLQNTEPGDLLFFSDRKGGKKVTHVGIVVQNDYPKSVRFIHASTRKGVIEEDVMSAWYKSIYLFSKRVL